LVGGRKKQETRSKKQGKSGCLLLVDYGGNPLSPMISISLDLDGMKTYLRAWI
jgi:hypothetical protein